MAQPITAEVALPGVPEDLGLTPPPASRGGKCCIRLKQR